METIEIIVYFSLSVILGAIILNFIGAIDAEKIYGSLKEQFSSDEKLKFVELTKEEFVSTTVKFWEQNAMCMMDATLVVYVKNDIAVDSLHKAYLFEKVKSIHMCSVLQSKDNDCGTQENVVFTDIIPLPKIVSLSCDTATEQLMIK